MWRLFRKRGELFLAGEDTSRLTIGERVFYRALDTLAAETLSADTTEARTHVLAILHDAECEALDRSLNEITGRFGRLWYDFLVRHDALPPSSQLQVESLLIARDLVSAFAQGSTRTRSAARRVLQLVDTSFQSGNLALCEVLLALFDTEPETRRHNERNVFFDRYTRRMFHQRRRLLTPAEIHEFRGIASASGGDNWVRSTLQWLADNAGIVFAARQIDPRMQHRTVELTDHQRTTLRSVMRSGMPYERFRRIDATTDLVEAAHRMTLRLVQNGPLEHMKRSIESAYFVALSAGRNDSDELLFDMDPWLYDTLRVDTPTLLARVHKASRVEDNLLKDALDLALNEEAAQWVFASRFTHTQISSIISGLPRRLRDLDIQSVPEGLYDLESFIGDLALEVPQRRLSRRLRLCRYI